MSNSLEFRCPSCGSKGEKSVVRTHRPHYFDSSLNSIGLKGDEILFRKRERHCYSCKENFNTVEISERDFEDVINAASRQIRNAKNYFDAQNSLLKKTVNLRKSIIAKGFCMILNDLSHDELIALEVINELCEEKVTQINEIGEEFLETLDENDSKFLVFHYCLDGLGGATPADDLPIVQYRLLWSKIRHPKRYRILLKIKKITLR